MSMEQVKTGCVLALVSDHPRVIALLRTAKRYAQKTGMPWLAVHIDDHRQKSDKESQTRILQALTLAEEMGGATETLDIKNSVDGLRHFLEQQEGRNVPVKMIFVGELEKKSWIENLHPSFTERLKKALPCAVESIPLEGSVFMHRSWKDWLQLRDLRMNEVFYAVAAIVIATMAIEIVNFFIPEAFGSALRNRRMIYVIAAAFISGRYGLVPGMIAAVGGYLTMNFLYVQPTFHTLIRNVADVVDLGLFMAAAFILGLLVNRHRITADQREEQMNRMQALFRMYRISFRTHSYQQTLEALHKELSAILKTDIIFFLPPPFNPDRLEAAMPAQVTLAPEDEAALDLCWQEAKITGFATPYYDKSAWRFKPLLTPSTVIGVLAIHMNSKSVADEAYRRLRTAIADSVALILERLMMGQAMEDVRLREEREKLRSMLLSSVSHDLKTPLASVIGSLSVYRSIGAQLPEAQRLMLIQTALEEAQRLDSFITNILDMTRLESGQIRFKQEWVRPSELMRSVEKRLRGRLHYHHLEIQKSDGDENEICIDMMMTEQVLQNILDNAAKYTPRGTHIEVKWRVENGQFHFEVRDRGPGIPEGHLDKIFDKYARIKRQDSQVAGTGLGLAIARSVMQAQGGGITASNHAEGGAVFTITLPRWRKVSAQDEKRVA
ncbi:MAG: DUF4118 domain-containing protein [Proteobacteria bacterium]|nr:DUF4118 domain-containing protein [Pseudomonadota bacterium]